MPTPPQSDRNAPAAERRLAAGIAIRLRHHRAAILALAVRGFSVMGAFAVTYVLGNRYGPEATGAYALVTQTAMFLAVAGLLGLDISVVRHFSRAVAQAMPVALQSLVQVLGLGFAMMGVIALTLWLGGDLVWERLFGDVVGRELLLVLCILLIGRGGAQLLGGLLRSQHQFTLGQAIAALTVPGWTAIALVTGIARTVEDALWAAAYAGLASIVIGMLAMMRHTGRGDTAVTIPMKAVVISSLPLWGASVVQQIGDWYGLAVAAQMLGGAEAGLYRVAAQLAGALQIISTALFSVYSAKISTAFHAGDRRQAALIARTAARMSTALAVPLAVLLLIGGEPLLALFGPDFVAAREALIILVIGQMAFTLTGPCGLVLAMSGHERINLVISIAGTLALLVITPLAAALAGLAGMTASIASIMLARNIAAYFVVRHKVGIRIWAGTANNAASGTPA
jgi:O-antigen/teichoic acid export membrane protein